MYCFGRLLIVTITTTATIIAKAAIDTLQKRNVLIEEANLIHTRIEYLIKFYSIRLAYPLMIIRFGCNLTLRGCQILFFIV